MELPKMRIFNVPSIIARYLVTRRLRGRSPATLIFTVNPSLYGHAQFLSLFTLTLVWVCCRSPVAAQTFPVPFVDPAKMFETTPGEDEEAERKELDAIEVTIEEERQLGKQMLQAALATLKSSGISTQTTGRDVDYLQSLVETVRPFMRNQDRYETINVILADSRRIDARSYPAGTLIFFRGLLDAAGSEAALVGIVGHELSHLDRGHQLVPIKKRKLMERTLSKSLTKGEFQLTVPEAMRLWAQPFRPEDEREADLDGGTWCYKAGYDSREMAKLFKPKGATASVPEDSPWATFFRSHPPDHERCEAILKQYVKMRKEHPPVQPLALGRENLRKRVSRKQAEIP